MKNNIIIKKSLIFSILLIIWLCNSYGQSNILILEVKNVNKNILSYPCLSINDCIDTIYKDKDTLFILLQDTRKFYKDERATIVLSQGYKINKRILEIPIQMESNYNFVILKTFDFICVFIKHKNQTNRYKIFSIKENTNYDDKEFKDIKNSNDVNIRNTGNISN